MTHGTPDACLEIFGIGSGFEHGIVVVSLDHQMVGLPDIKVGALGNHTHIGGNHNVAVATLNKEATVVGAVVADIESRDGEIADFERVLFIDGAVVILQTVRYIMAPQQPVERARVFKKLWMCCQK